MGDPTNTVLASDHSIASLSGSSQSLVAADMMRSLIAVHNPGNQMIAINPTGGTAALNTGGCVNIVPNGTVWYDSGSILGNAMTVIGTSGQPVTCITSP